jgi:uncharacterized protein (DUF1501 family)
MSFTRRNFLWNGLRFGALTPFLSELSFARSLGGGSGERVLVVLQLTGGNDGLNTLVPHRQDTYWRIRPTLGLSRGALHDLDGEHGLHPAMDALAKVFQEGKLAIVQGIGSPNPDRSHFRALEMWHTADPFGPAGDVGWLGRLADQIVGKDPHAIAALAIESGDLPLSMRAERFLAPTVSDPLGFREHEETGDFAEWRDALLVEQGAGDLAYLRASARSTYEAAARMAEITSAGDGADYPGYELARRLKLVASLVAGGFGTRIFHLSLGGFDTHARQAPVHEDLLRQLSSSLAAFQHDLEAKGVADRVLLFAFSEFGRRAAENGSKGTDHGCGAPAFLMGAKVRAGLHGTAPDLDALVEGDVQQTTDFRAVYSALERNWMELRSATDIAPLDVLAI